MTSSDFSLDKRQRTYARLIGEIRHQLHKALDEESVARQLTQQQMADVLNTSKSFISRKMNGTSNMTLETLADLAYALDRVVKVELRSRRPSLGSNALLEEVSPYDNLAKTGAKSSTTSDAAAQVKLKIPETELVIS